MKDKKTTVSRQTKNKKGDNRLSPFCVDKTLIEEGNPCFPYHSAKLQKIFISE